jgi:hypothetical protein
LNVALISPPAGLRAAVINGCFFGGEAAALLHFHGEITWRRDDVAFFYVRSSTYIPSNILPSPYRKAFAITPKHITYHASLFLNFIVSLDDNRNHDRPYS